MFASKRYMVLFFISLSFLHTSTLDVYQDKAIYSVSDGMTYIGFTKDIEVACGAKTLQVLPLLECPPNERLCSEYSKLQELLLKQDAIENTLGTLTLFESNFQSQTSSATTWLETAKNLGLQKALLKQERATLEQQIAMAKSAFGRQAPSMNPFAINGGDCKDSVEVTLPYGQVTFDHHYSADIANPNKIEITHSLKVLNQSGIDIKAKDAKFFYRSARAYIPAISFSPWVIYKQDPTPQPRAVAMAMSKEASYAQDAMSPAPKATYEDAREYSVSSLNLLSSGEPTNFAISKEIINSQCDFYVYAYESTTAFMACKFDPQYEIESHQWEVKEKEKILNSSASGAYQDGKYVIYVAANEEILVTRKEVIPSGKSTGIFGNIVKKQDGFEVTVLNKSTKPQEITVVERVPVTTTDEIGVKIVSIEGTDSKSYTQDKEGRLNFALSLKPNETKKITVLFEVSHHKDITPNY